MLAVGLFVGLGLLIPFTLSCSAQPPEDAALKSLRNLSSRGQLPAESVVANIESRFAGTKTGALARLLRARIRLENGNAVGAAELLSSDVFQQKTSISDYALWLRGKALLKAQRRGEAHQVFSTLIQKYPGSTRIRDAKLLWAESAYESGLTAKVPEILKTLIEKKDAEALLLTAKAYEKNSDDPKAIEYYRKTYFYGAGSLAGNEAEAKLKELEQGLTPRNAEESLAKADILFSKKNYRNAAAAYEEFARYFGRNMDSSIKLKQLTSQARSGQIPQARGVFNSIPLSAKEKEEAFYQFIVGSAKFGNWSDAKQMVAEMRQKFPRGKWTPKALIDAGLAARDKRRKLQESYFLKMAVAAYPNAIDVTKAHFELAWLEHQKKNYRVSSRMLTEHLARYVDKDNSHRGQSGYWAARDSEKAGKIREACALYDAVAYRYGANWYGYLALEKVANIRKRGQCQTPARFPAGSLIPKAVANMKVVTVAAETATPKELALAEKSEQLSTVGLFDWAREELRIAKKTANNSPRINLSLAKHYRMKGDNVNALLTMRKSYPDYSQMFPEEMGREEWDIFYPLTHWNDIKYWANRRRLDPYQVAGLIRQETIFDPNAKSSANAYGLMQLLIPTARMMARKYGASAETIYGSTLYNPRLNIELGTAYM
ncbi:MAG: transglycosylase SLT domain-containing protein, partial [Pyrinomonadaceae bacterium]|nr:transglycosylase SLT domain-containing protein [Pyrinomonadaceae bacterium]